MSFSEKMEERQESDYGAGDEFEREVNRRSFSRSLQESAPVNFHPVSSISTAG